MLPSSAVLIRFIIALDSISNITIRLLSHIAMIMHIRTRLLISTSSFLVILLISINIIIINFLIRVLILKVFKVPSFCLCVFMKYKLPTMIILFIATLIVLTVVKF